MYLLDLLFYLTFIHLTICLPFPFPSDSSKIANLISRTLSHVTGNKVRDLNRGKRHVKGTIQGINITTLIGNFTLPLFDTCRSLLHLVYSDSRSTVNTIDIAKVPPAAKGVEQEQSAPSAPSPHHRDDKEWRTTHTDLKWPQNS